MYFVDYIPKYSYTYTLDKTAELTEEDRQIATAPEKEIETEAGEGTEVTEPTIVRTQKDKNLYKDKRNSYEVEELTDASTGIVYAHLSLVDDNAAINMDAHGLPKPKLGNGVVYIKVLMRTNQNVSPYVVVYHLKDEAGTALGSKNAVALNATKGGDEWEEVILKVVVPEEAVTFEQIHLMPAGNVKGSSYFTNGVLKDNAYFDVAAWAAFENLASAKAYDLKAAAK